MTQGHTETRRKEVAEYVGTVQYVGGGDHCRTPEIAKERVWGMRHEVCIVKNMSSHGLILILEEERQTNMTPKQEGCGWNDSRHKRCSGSCLWGKISAMDKQCSVTSEKQAPRRCAKRPVDMRASSPLSHVHQCSWMWVEERTSHPLSFK